LAPETKPDQAGRLVSPEPNLNPGDEILRDTSCPLWSIFLVFHGQADGEQTTLRPTAPRDIFPLTFPKAAVVAHQLQLVI
jgi:hypothetical protein